MTGYCPQEYAMEPEFVELKREELYKQVWSQPMSALARTYGMSDVGLAKICKKFEIPVPGRGYWEKKAHGKAVKEEPLPLITLQRNSIIQIQIKKKPMNKEHDKKVEAMIAFERQHENRITVETALISPHPLIVETAVFLKKEVNFWNNPSYSRLRHLDISVSENMVDRALRVADALVKALEARGYEVSAPRYDDRENKTTVLILGEKVEFKIREAYVRVNRPVSSRRGRRPSMLSLLDQKPEYETSPSGRLLLKIEEYLDGQRKQWSDGARGKIENFLNDFIIGLINAAVVLKERTLEWQRREQEERERQRRREEVERQRREEEARFQALIKEVDFWHRSKQIRAYIAAVREQAIQKEGQIAPGSDLEKWFIWAAEQADHIDPLKKNKL